MGEFTPRYSAFDVGRERAVDVPSPAGRLPMWNEDGTPSNEDARQVTCWVLHYLDAGKYQLAKMFLKNCKTWGSPSAYPPGKAAVNADGVSPWGAIRKWVEVRAADPEKWRELCAVRVSERQIYKMATPEVRESIERWIVDRVDGKGQPAKRSMPYIEELRIFAVRGY